MRQIEADILSNERLAPGRFKMRLEAPSICKHAKPGQFVMVKCSNGIEPFLRRPLSFHRIEKNSFELLYQVVGKGTEILSETKLGERLDIIGPLGNGFEIDSKPSRKSEIPPEAGKTQNSKLLIAGGIGVAPLLGLAERLAYSVERIAFSVFIGARKKKHLLCEKDFKKLGARVYVATEDGSKGYKGLVTGLLRKKLSAIRYPLSAIYACGPKEMLKEVAKISRSKGISCQVSLEERMACGTGACLGCAVKTVTGYKLACKDGPIFNAGDIIW